MNAIAYAKSIARPVRKRLKNLFRPKFIGLRYWSDTRNLQNRWWDRARIAGSLIPEGSHVIDLGCGAMDLRKFLPDGCTYVGCDIADRDGSTIVRDFNAGEFPDEAYREADVVTMLGVIEYIHKPEAVIEKMTAGTAPVIISYHPANGKPRGYGWVNNLSRDELVAAFAGRGFALSDEIALSERQTLFRFARD